MNTLLLTLTLLISFNSYADYQDGLDAYEKGDYKTAFNEWQPLAEQGDSEAQYKLGYLYDFGEGVLKDDKEAVKWYTKAAEQGLSKSQYNLSLMYYEGEGIEQDQIEAVKWLTKAAEQGDADAQ